MGTFVIVHGAWGGGWAWRPTVGRLLRDAGHEVFTPTLTGLGERTHLASPAVDLETHIQDILGVLEWEDLRDVVLVGHSYGGMVITGVADRASERLKHLVYVDAMVPEDGQSLADLIGPDAAARMQAQAQAEGDGWRIPPSPLPPETPPERRTWVEPRRGAQPLKTFIQPVHLTGASRDLPRTYVYCTNPPGEAFTRIATRLRQDPQWRVVDFPTGHNVHYGMPRELADLLLELVPAGAGAAR
jgi:pimeloyl-ACP methyl ester carboxylesterase